MLQAIGSGCSQRGQTVAPDEARVLNADRSKASRQKRPVHQAAVAVLEGTDEQDGVVKIPTGSDSRCVVLLLFDFWR